ncbi:hypothetical protein [Paracoccus tegillarcae]|uniref:hypothetical protein n=1 Tax=Paracoccus tegillarcae TaxID=1529068 RepID=UPI0013004FC1|nr:hypothetical protein [Paracoccus tegillarcae]
MTLPRISIVAWLVLTPLLCALYLTVPPSPDQSLFDYIAWSRLQGDYYYVGVAEQNWPGMMFIHEIGIRIFGVAFWTFHAFDFVLLQILTGAGMLLLYRARFRIAPWVFLLLYPAVYVTAGWWMAGQRDIVAMGLLVAAAALTLPAVSRDSDGFAACFLSGAVIFLAVITRPTYLTFLALLMLLELGLFLTGQQRFKRASLRALMMFTGFALPLGLLILQGQRIGALDDFYQQTILFNIEGYQVPQSRMRLFEPMFVLLTKSWHWITLLAAVGVALWLWTKGLSRALILILGLFATILISYFVQNKGFGYHLGGLLTLFCLLVGVSFDRVGEAAMQARTSSARLLNGGLLLGMALLAAAGTGKKILGTAPDMSGDQAYVLAPNDELSDGPDWDEISQVVAMIKSETTQDDHILQWGRDFSIPFLAERRSSIRFVSTPALDVMTPSFSGYDAWLDEVTRDLVDKRPAFIIVTKEVLSNPVGEGFAPREGASPAESLLVEHLADYKLRILNEDIGVFQDP